MLGNVEKVPSATEIAAYLESNDLPAGWDERQKLAQKLLNQTKIQEAWQVLMAD